MPKSCYYIAVVDGTIERTINQPCLIFCVCMQYLNLKVSMMQMGETQHSSHVRL